MNVSQFDDAGWRARAACRGLDVSMFIPDGTGTGQPLYAEARTVCAMCIVRNACLDYALANHEEMGMWGGTTPEDRRKLGYGPVLVMCSRCGTTVPRSSTNQKYCSRACGLTRSS